MSKTLRQQVRLPERHMEDPGRHDYRTAPTSRRQEDLSAGRRTCPPVGGPVPPAKHVCSTWNIREIQTPKHNCSTWNILEIATSASHHLLSFTPVKVYTYKWTTFISSDRPGNGMRCNILHLQSLCGSNLLSPQPEIHNTLTGRTQSRPSHFTAWEALKP